MYIILAPMDTIRGIELARMAYERRYKNGWVWCEATTLAEIDRLQKRLVDQEIREAEKRVHLNTLQRERVFKQTGDALRQQMVSSSTTPFERDFIKQYFALREGRRDKFRDALLHHNRFIMAREYDSTHNVEDSLPLLPGQVENASA